MQCLRHFSFPHFNKTLPACLNTTPDFLDCPWLVFFQQTWSASWESLVSKTVELMQKIRHTVSKLGYAWILDHVHTGLSPTWKESISGYQDMAVTLSHDIKPWTVHPWRLRTKVSMERNVNRLKKCLNQHCLETLWRGITQTDLNCQILKM